MSVVRHFTVEVPWGVVHGRTGSSRAGDPVVLLHQTPRSGDEFREVIESLGSRRHLVAFDLPGMGHSSPHPDGDTIEAYTAGITDAMDAYGIERCVLVGHHTGAAVAATIAADRHRQIGALVLSSPPWIDADARQARKARTGPGVDEFTRDEDGGHLVALWQGRAGFYPADRIDLLERFVADAMLTADPGAGHRAVTDWAMEANLARLQTIRVVLVDHEADPHAHPNIKRWVEALADPIVLSIPDGMVPLEYTADAFSDALESVLDGLDS